MDKLSFEILGPKEIIVILKVCANSLMDVFHCSYPLRGNTQKNRSFLVVGPLGRGGGVKTL